MQVGNKSDLRHLRAVPTDEAKERGQKNIVVPFITTMPFYCACVPVLPMEWSGLVYCRPYQGCKSGSRREKFKNDNKTAMKLVPVPVIIVILF